MHELFPNDGIITEHTFNDCRCHDTLLPRTARLLAHVTAFHDEGDAERFRLTVLRECIFQHLYDVMRKAFLYLKAGRAVVHDTPDFDMPRIRPPGAGM